MYTSKLKGNEYPVSFRDLYTGDNFCDFLFVILHTKPIRKRVPFKERIRS